MSLEDQLEELRRATKQYRKIERADEDGYASATPLVCGMGFHYINFGRVGSTDPLEPQAVVYPLKGGRQLHLAALEYIVPKAGPFEDDPPDLFNDEGEDLETSEADGWVELEEGELTAWTLHAWVHDDNEEGVFHPTNPQYHDMPGCAGH